MLRTMMTSNIHRATVTRADPHHIVILIADGQMETAEALPGGGLVRGDSLAGAR